MKNIEIPACKQQKIFEDFVKTLLKVAAELNEASQDSLLEYAMNLASDEKNT